MSRQIELSMGAVLRIGMMRRLWYAQTISLFGDFVALFSVVSVLTFRVISQDQQRHAAQTVKEIRAAQIELVKAAQWFVDEAERKASSDASTGSG
jgi:DHA3 family macrolide efflux protein-like MFS transporter